MIAQNRPVISVAAKGENQRASPPNKAGSAYIIAIGATRDPTRERSPETRPFPSPVKKDETNRLKPIMMQESDRMRIAWTVSRKVSSS